MRGSFTGGEREQVLGPGPRTDEAAALTDGDSEPARSPTSVKPDSDTNGHFGMLGRPIQDALDVVEEVRDRHMPVDRQVPRTLLRRRSLSHSPDPLLQCRALCPEKMGIQIWTCCTRYCKTPLPD